MSAWTYQTAPELNDEQYARWQSLLEQRTGICFSQHKLIMQTGLSQRMREVGIDDYEQYFQQVSAVPEGLGEWAQLVDRISVKETRFFRESNSFNTVRDYLLKRLDDNVRPQEYTLDIWSVGCSTGEEAYSLAIIANEVIDYLAAKCFLGVIGTDISQIALSTARQACYTSPKLDGLMLALKNKYFVKNETHKYRVIDSLRQRLCFIQGNILELDSAPRLAMDVIYCQNVLVYFRRDRQWAVLDELVKHLKPGGLLIIGLGEAMGWQHPLMLRSRDDAVQAYVKQE